MVEVQLVLAADLGVDAREIADAWENDTEAKALMDASPEVHRSTPTHYDFPQIVEFVVIPLAVNVGSTVLIELVTRLYRKCRPLAGDDVAAVEETTDDNLRTVFVMKKTPISDEQQSA
ncbi:hypothetical protein ACQP2E_11850 [Actinoplanes sp. CA-015351]|uniref:hypothetical protein n=1 Tax=Actinoplanes sp. CA-015351 TaxID=3239897 RepID=UPI003D9890DA